MKGILKSIVVYILTVEAKILLRRTRPQIIAVTGSVGKTSVKDAIYTALKGKLRIRKSEKSYNSEIGVPLSVLGLQNAWSSPLGWFKNIADGALIALHPGDYPKVLVLEMGVDRPGDMAKLTEWIRPDVVVLTRLPDVPVHVEYFSSPDAVVEEKIELVRALKENGVFVYNHDDEKARKAAESIGQQSIGYSRYSLSPYTVSADKIIYKDGRPEGVDFMLTHLDQATNMTVHGALGVQHAYNYAAAAAVASVFGIGILEVRDALSSHVPPPGRMRMIEGIKNTILIDDTYNSSPVAAERSITTLGDLKGVGRRVAILGDMLELGQYSVREHERIGELAASVVDQLICVGVRARSIAAGAQEHGMSKKHILQFDDTKHAVLEVAELIKQGDVVLVKGSQGIRAEHIVKKLMEHPEDAKALLVRQSSFWKRNK
jgi:UDP-N-acetylmuramyl pentapeptide synthase